MWLKHQDPKISALCYRKYDFSWYDFHSQKTNKLVPVKYSFFPPELNRQNFVVEISVILLSNNLLINLWCKVTLGLRLITEISNYHRNRELLSHRVCTSLSHHKPHPQASHIRFQGKLSGINIRKISRINQLQVALVG